MTVKAAGSAAAAWQLGHLIPDPVDQFSYYAPLGAILATSQLVVNSLKESAQMVYAIVLGGAVALLADAMGQPDVVTISVLVAVCMLAAGAPGLGSSRSWVPVAGLFVLIIGSGNSGEYIVGYVTQVVLGVAVGVAVNGLLPPLPLGVSGYALDQVSDGVAEQLRAVSEILREEPIDDGGAGRRVDVARLALQARTDIERINESLRGNFRARRYRERIAHERDRADVLNRVALSVQGLVSLFQAARDDALGASMDYADAEAIAGTVDTVAGFIENTRGSTPSAEDGVRLDEAIAELERRTRDMRDGDRNGYQETAVVTILLRQLQLVSLAAPPQQPAGETPQPS